MKESKILLVGNCVVDQIWALDRFPQQDEEVRVLSKTKVAGGNVSNTAQILASLGDDVEIVSSLAEDSTAKWMLQELSNKGISTSHCTQHSGYSTPESSIWLNSQNGSRTIVHHRDLPELSLQELMDIPVQQFQWLHFEGRNIDTIKSYLLNRAIVNQNISLEIEKPREGIEDLLPYVNIVIVSQAYLKSKKLNAQQCIKSFTAINPDINIVCTQGSSGVTAKDQMGIIRLQAVKVNNVVDTVGAGDCFIGALIHRLNKNDDFESALVFANQLAAKKIQFKGMKYK